MAVSNGLDYARVLRVRDKHRVDIKMLHSGAIIQGVQVTAGAASTNSGQVDLPEPTEPTDKEQVELTRDRDVFAVVGYIDNLPLVIGFLYPTVSQLMFADHGLSINRHASDWYTTVDGDGNFEASHPSGTYIRIGEDTAHRDLTGQDLDGKWAITKNTDRDVHVHISVASGGEEVASLSLGPDGVITSKGTWNHTGAFNVDGDMDVTGDAHVEGTVTGDTDVVVSGKGLKAHKHLGVTTGGGVTGLIQ